MRKFRNAALAAATAATVAFAGVSVASAQDAAAGSQIQGSTGFGSSAQGEVDTDQDTTDGTDTTDTQTQQNDAASANPISSGSSQPEDASLSSLLSSGNSSQIGFGTDAWQYDADGNPVVTQDDNMANATDLLGSSIDDTENPQWSRIWRDVANIAAIAAALGGVIAAYNAAVYQGIIPHAIQF